MIQRAQTPPVGELEKIVDQKIAALVRELEDADWGMETIIFAMRDCLQAKWITEAEALRKARDAVPDTFVSDGNEG